MEFQIEFPKEEFSDFLNEYIASGHEGEQEDETSGGSFQIVEYTGENTGEYLGNAGLVVLIGLTVVIGALVVLVAIFKAVGLIMTGAGKKKAPKIEQPKNPEAPATPAPVVQDGIGDEVVAVIAAAIAAMAPGGKKYALKRVSRADAGGRSAWSAAGLADNTRPF